MLLNYRKQFGPFMSTRRELEALRKRLNQLVPMIQPPELKLHVIGANDPIPTSSPWELIIRIEDQNPAFNK